jgi:hypothetical protein
MSTPSAQCLSSMLPHLAHYSNRRQGRRREALLAAHVLQMALNWNMRNNRGFPAESMNWCRFTVQQTSVCRSSVTMTPPFRCSWRKTTKTSTERLTTRNLLLHVPVRVHSSSQAGKTARRQRNRTSLPGIKPQRRAASTVSSAASQAGQLAKHPPKDSRSAYHTKLRHTTKSPTDNSMVQCNASLLGRPVGPMSSKAYCRPYIWYVFCAMSVSWINCTVSVHSHLAHVRNSWLKT